MRSAAVERLRVEHDAAAGPRLRAVDADLAAELHPRIGEERAQVEHGERHLVPLRWPLSRRGHLEDQVAVERHSDVHAHVFGSDRQVAGGGDAQPGALEVERAHRRVVRYLLAEEAEHERLAVVI